MIEVMSATQTRSGTSVRNRRATRSVPSRAPPAPCASDADGWHALQPGRSDQPGHSLAGDADPFGTELSCDPGCTVGAPRRLMDLTNPLRERTVVDLAPRRWTPRPVVEGRGGNGEITTQHLHAERGPLRSDEPLDAHAVSIPLAKKAPAF
jgi:hypothetical protein